LVISSGVPWYYLQPTTPIVSGRKWLGVTYVNYDGGGAYVSGVYDGSPAQQVGLEVGDVIVSLDGIDATDLPAAIQAANNVARLQVLSGRTGELVEGRVNLLVP
jgi:predicted metalloprotease with PDZ domain